MFNQAPHLDLSLATWLGMKALPTMNGNMSHNLSNQATPLNGTSTATV